MVQVSRTDLPDKLDHFWEEILFRSIGSDLSKLSGVQCLARGRDVLLQVWMEDVCEKRTIRKEILSQILRTHKRAYFLPCSDC